MLIEANAVIKNAAWMAYPDGTWRITGRIHQDQRRRFHDGEQIVTSAVIDQIGEDMYRTKNSVYVVHFAPRAERPQNIPITVLPQSEAASLASSDDVKAELLGILETGKTLKSLGDLVPLFRRVFRLAEAALKADDII